MSKFKLIVLATAALVVVALTTSLKQSAAFGTSTDSIVLKKKIVNTDPPCLQMYYYIEQYTDSFNIPKDYAYGIAYAETRYNGPFHWKYNPKQTSSVGAVGPMQVMPSTAAYINGVGKVSISKLKSDIAYNIMTSMKLLRRLHDKYGDWKTVFGAYNTGRPCINRYALNVYNYKPNW
jgi:soluble lytic murein transglycosylase-like protein